MEYRRKQNQTRVLLSYLKIVKEFCEIQNMEIEYGPSRLLTSTRAFERAIQTLGNLFVASLEDRIG